MTSHHITLHYFTLHYITLHYITLHHITSQYITLHYITLHYITYIHNIHKYMHTCMHTCIGYLPTCLCSDHWATRSAKTLMVHVIVGIFLPSESSKEGLSQTLLQQCLRHSGAESRHRRPCRHRQVAKCSGDAGGSGVSGSQSLASFQLRQGQTPLRSPISRSLSIDSKKIREQRIARGPIGIPHSPGYQQ